MTWSKGEDAFGSMADEERRGLTRLSSYWISYDEREGELLLLLLLVLLPSTVEAATDEAEVNDRREIIVGCV